MSAPRPDRLAYIVGAHVLLATPGIVVAHGPRGLALAHLCEFLQRRVARLQAIAEARKWRIVL